ncbi:zinc-ribbon and DUF3426 domain-containing protein [Massilia sp. GCM10023247]|uniref:zinc-ribbon and DUF3426 domain-containing protein n=1 Tax=Massilia sp. GCM10023247 TaxID=3252643 RepID=UPI003605ADDA
MALATQCPHCGTMFRVASDQLKLRGGIVRCGACQEIFDGSATLVDLDKPQQTAAAAAVAAVAAVAASTAPPSPPPVPEAAFEAASEAASEAAAPAGDELPFTIVDSGEDSEPAAEALPDSADFDGQPVYTLDFDHTFDPLGILPKADAPDAAAGAAPADEEVDALALLQPWSRPPKDADQASAPAFETLPATQDPAPASEPALPVAETAAASAAEPLAQPAPPEPPAPPVRAATAPDSRGRYEPALGLPVDEELVAAPLPGHEPEPEPEPEPQLVAAAAPQPRPRADDAPPLLTRESAASTHTPAASIPPPPLRTPAARRAEKAAARRSKLTPTRIEPQPRLRAAEIDEPEFVKRSRHQEQAGRNRKLVMLAGSIVLLLLLIAQGAITFRNALAARFPATKPALVTSCALLGCRVELPAQVDKLTIETGELTTLGDGAYSFATELRNTAGTAQAWPSLELTLLDANDKPVARRVFPPSDYLAAGTLLENGIARGAVQPIKLHFRVDDLKPSGYHIAVFYP